MRLWQWALMLAPLVVLAVVASSDQEPRYMLPVWDRACVEVPRENCWRYAFLPWDWTLAPATTGPEWAQQLAAAPGTNPAYVVFAREGDEASRVIVTVEGELPAGQTDFPLTGLTVKPLTCEVYRNGARLSKGDFGYLAPGDGGDWSLRFLDAPGIAAVIIATCTKGP